MSPVTKSVSELLPSETCDLPGPRPRSADSRTRLKRYFLDPVLPVLTLLSMSALTVVMLVVIVTTVADMDAQLPGSYTSIDPWAGWTGGTPTGLYQMQGQYADLAAPIETAEDLELRPGPQMADPF